MTQITPVWSLRDPITPSIVQSKSSILRSIAALAYIDLFFHQTPNPDRVWNPQLVFQLGVKHNQILEHARRVFQKDDVDVLSNLLKIDATGYVDPVLRLYKADGDITSIQLIRWVLHCRAWVGALDVITIPTFFITPDVTLIPSQTAFKIDQVPFPGSPFVRWCAVILITLFAQGKYAFSTLLGSYVANIRLPVNALLQPSPDTPYPYTSFILRRDFFCQFYSRNDDVYTSTILKTMSKEFVRGTYDELYVAQVAGMVVLLENAKVAVTAMDPTVKTPNDYLFDPETAWLQTLPRDIQNKLYSDSAGNDPIFVSMYGIGIESLLVQADTSEEDGETTEAEADDDDDVDPVKGDETTDTDNTDDTEQANGDPLSTTPPVDDTTSTDSSTDSPDVGSDDDSTDPNMTQDIQSDSMDLITFDRNGESVNDALYRDAVLELARRIDTDASFPISINARDLLNSFAEFYLYRVGIADVKDFIKALGLEAFLTHVDVADPKTDAQ